MYSSRLVQLLLVTLSVFMAARATWLDMGFIGKAAHEIAGRADSSSSAPTAAKATSETSSQAAASTTSSASTSSADKTTSTTSKATSTSSNVQPASTSSTSQDQPTNTGTTTQPPQSTSSTDSTAGGVTSSSSTADAASPTDTTQSLSTSLVTTMVVITTTNPAGQTETLSSSAVITQTGTISQASSSGGDNATMSDSTKRTIIGVCVGVGGAIIVAVAGVMFWRLRRRGQGDDTEDLVNYGAGTSQFNSGPEKNEPAGGSVSNRSPFQSTLESYHAPTQSNTGTNF